MKQKLSRLVILLHIMHMITWPASSRRSGNYVYWIIWVAHLTMSM